MPSPQPSPTPAPSPSSSPGPVNPGSDPAWSLGRDSQGYLRVDSRSKYGVLSFQYEKSNRELMTGFPVGHGIPAAVACLVSRGGQ